MPSALAANPYASQPFVYTQLLPHASPPVEDDNSKSTLPSIRSLIGMTDSSVGNRGVGNLRLIGLVGLGPASRVFTCSLLDRLLTASTPYTKMPHMTSYSNKFCPQARAVTLERTRKSSSSKSNHGTYEIPQPRFLKHKTTRHLP